MVHAYSSVLILVYPCDIILIYSLLVRPSFSFTTDGQYVPIYLKNGCSRQVLTAPIVDAGCLWLVIFLFGAVVQLMQTLFSSYKLDVVL